MCGAVESVFCPSPAPIHDKLVNAVTQEYQYYTYNDKGLITTYYNNHNSDNYRYTYDVAGRLLSDGSYMYTYDELNNITTRSSPNFTNTYYYDETNKTRLIKISENYSMKYFKYDASGNMTTYKGSSENADKNLYWTRGNMLRSGSIKSGKSFIYEYDPNNLRYRKTVNGVTTDYYWNGGVLLGEKTGNNVTQYVYDANGIAGMFYNGTYYYFEKNLFGDVLRVYTNGTTVAEFKYDSWGNLAGSSGTFADNVKFRYRGYYYDDETGFYYLQSRYYDPSLGRFISADQLELLASLSQTLGQLNLYAYCNNNPIMFTDQLGEGPVLALFLAFASAFLVTGTVTFITQYNETGDFWGSLAKGASAGALSGVISASFTLGGLLGLGLIASKYAAVATLTAATAAFGAGVLNYGASECWFSGNEFEWNKALWHGTLAAVQSLVAVGMGAALSSAGLWNSLNEENSLGYTIKKAGPRISNKINEAIKFFKVNGGAMVARSFIKNTFVAPWGWIRPYI